MNEYPDRPAVPSVVRQHAACAGEPTALFFEPIRNTTTGLMDYGTLDPTEAKQICARCPVRAECLAYAIEWEFHGIWGGLTPKERRRLSGRGPNRGSRPQPIRHGTPGGYRTHKRRGEPACVDCLAAKARDEQQKNWRRQNRTAAV